MANGPSLSLNHKLADYFHLRLQELGRRQSTPPQDDTLWYVGDMLARFGDSDQLFSYEHGRIDIRPLALLYKDAHETNNVRERGLILRQLGDMALFMGALFPENYQRRGLKKAYFVGMGGGAYSYLSETELKHRHIFAELATSFTLILELIAQACEKQTSFDNGDVLTLYQRWQKNREPRIAAQLRALGIEISDTNFLH
ncbi:hypothetical protein [Zhongshania sp.]|jgi:hypothetical protein|uniref:hypothetical protein n=1 Tax=Zhongshania sp. TaxID=1971902 RepID=UPI002A7F44AA|nr:hypothetical protein [Zhongshania sp.]